MAPAMGILAEVQQLNHGFTAREFELCTSAQNPPTMVEWKRGVGYGKGISSLLVREQGRAPYRKGEGSRFQPY